VEAKLEHLESKSSPTNQSEENSTSTTNQNEEKVNGLKEEFEETNDEGAGESKSLARILWIGMILIVLLALTLGTNRDWPNVPYLTTALAPYRKPVKDLLLQGCGLLHRVPEIPELLWGFGDLVIQVARQAW